MPKSSSELFPVSKAYNPLSRQPNNEDRAWLYNELSGYGKFTGTCWLLSPEPQVEPQHIPVPIVHDILSSHDFIKIQATEKLVYFQEKMKIFKEAITSVAQISSGQQANEIWHQVRKGRLTASNFGAVLQAKKVTQSLMKRLLGEYDLSGVKSIMWGTQHEKDAVSSFSKTTGLVVNKTGIWLDDAGILGASPDGLIGEDALLEVKCPYSLRNETVCEGLKQKNFFLMACEEDLFLRKDHAYWHQVQGQLHLANRKMCYFVIWTKQDMKILQISKDESWCKNLDALRQFYFEHIFPAMIEAL